jgi:hypothetical protein
MMTIEECATLVERVMRDYGVTFRYFLGDREIMLREDEPDGWEIGIIIQAVLRSLFAHPLLPRPLTYGKSPFCYALPNT